MKEKKEKKEKKHIVNTGMRLFAVVGIVACLFASYMTIPASMLGNANSRYASSDHYLTHYSFGADYYTESYNAAYETVNAVDDLGKGAAAINNNLLSISDDLGELKYTIEYVAHITFAVFAIGFCVLFFASAKPNPNYTPVEKKKLVKRKILLNR